MGAGRTGFHIIKFSVSQGAANGSEAGDVVCGKVHVNGHGTEKDSYSYSGPDSVKI